MSGATELSLKPWLTLKHTKLWIVVTVAVPCTEISTMQHAEKYLLVVSEASFVPSFSASLLQPLLLYDNIKLDLRTHYFLKIFIGTQYDTPFRIWPHSSRLPCCLLASFAACNMACFSSFLISLSWAACRAISATWWNTLHQLQIVLHIKSADIHTLS